MTYWLAKREKKDVWEEEFNEGVPGRSRHWALDLLMLVGGLVVLVIGSRLLVDNCIIVARALGVSEAVIGLTIIAAGTSMPELATSVVAALRKEPDIAVGNIIGSNIFNILMILGISSSIHPFEARGIGMVDLAAMVVLTVLLIPVIMTESRLARWEGALLLVCYIGYVSYLWPA